MATRTPARRPRVRSTQDSVLVHDIRNLGLRLSLLLSNMEEHYGDPDFKRSAEDLLQSTIQKLDGIARSWSSRGNAVLIKVPLDLNDLVREVLRTCEPRGRASAPGMTLSFAEVPGIWGDSYYLREAIQSVVQNAQEAAASSVSVRTILERRGARNIAVVEVEDNGPGMPEAFMRRDLFRPFRTTKPEGVGLGLYAARRILRHHHGDVEVTSTEGEGTRVRLLLPLPAARGRKG
ncbi:MAG: ATP-binding protein [Acidobacteriota bacterium]|nr:ATP-binding protein [Acidobacteriota bacterium]